MTYISPNAIVEDGVYIGRNTAILAHVHLKRGTIVEDNCIVGKPSRAQMGRFQELLKTQGRKLTFEDYDSVVDTPTVIGENAQIHSGTIVYSGCTLEEGVIAEDRCVVRWDTTIGAHTKLMIAAFVGAKMTIGTHSRIGGISGNGSKIGSYVTNFGYLIHNYTSFGGNRAEPAPTIGDFVMIGYTCNIIGGVTVGSRSYIAAGATVSRDVPPETVVIGFNQHRPMSEWKGTLRQDYLASFPVEPLTWDETQS